MISVTDLRSGTVFEHKGEYFLVLSYEHIKMGRGSGTVKVKVKNLTTSAVIDKSFTTGTKVNEASLVRKKVQYLYSDDKAHLMDINTFEQFAIEKRMINEVFKSLKEGIELTLA